MIQLIRNTAQESSANFLVLSIIYWILFHDNFFFFFRFFILWAVLGFWTFSMWWPSCPLVLLDSRVLACPQVLEGQQATGVEWHEHLRTLNDVQPKWLSTYDEPLVFATQRQHQTILILSHHWEPGRQTQDIQLLMCEQWKTVPNPNLQNGTSVRYENSVTP